MKKQNKKVFMKFRNNLSDDVSDKSIREVIVFCLERIESWDDNVDANHFLLSEETQISRGTVHPVQEENPRNISVHSKDGGIEFSLVFDEFGKNIAT